MEEITRFKHMKLAVSLSSLLFIFLFVVASLYAAGKYLDKRNKMIYEQILARGVDDEQVISAMRKVGRHLFVPKQQIPFAYDDRPLPIGHGQTISQPYIVAYMSAALDLQPDDVVLEIGTGSGYQAAILAEIVEKVYTIEILKPLAIESEKRLARLGYTNIEVKHGDGYLGWPEKAPFDKIIVTASPKSIPMELVDQLKIGGKMILPAGSFFQQLYLIQKTEDGFEKKPLIPVRFVPMVHSQ
jgi:protein-L-isoaspartate(D-aspartate) O-methyltransferase